MQTFTNTQAGNSYFKRNVFTHVMIILALFLSFITGSIKAQVGTVYTYAASTGISFETITSPTVLTTCVGGTFDDDYNLISPAGFTFNYNGTNYTQFGASTNAWVKMGNTSATSIFSSLTSVGSVNGVVAFGRDARLNQENGGNLTHGPAAGGKYVFQFVKNSGGSGGAASATSYIDMQIVLWGSTSATPGKIEIIYGASIGTPATAGTIGIVDATNSYINGVNGLNNDLTTSANWPVSGQRYAFTPVVCAGPANQPTGLSFGASTFSSIPYSFTAAAGSPTGYLVVRYPASSATTNPVNATTYTVGQSLGLGTVVASGAAVSGTATGLVAGTTYDFYVYSFTNTACLFGPAYNTTSPLTAPAATTTGTVAGGSIPIGPTAPAAPAGYPSLTAAFAAINAGGLTGNIDLQLQSDYVSTVETFPITSATAGAGGGFTIKVYPTVTGLSITSSNATGTFNFNNAGNIIIDGRVNATGSTKDLVVSNTNPGTSYAIQFINDSRNNTVQYCTITSRNTSATSGTIVFSTSTGLVYGNDNNTIANNDILDGTSTPLNAIYSAGTSAAIDNSGNIISNNNIANYFSATTATNGMLLTATGNAAWTITNNRFYQTANRVYTTGNTHNGISILTGGGYTITGNTIGFGNAAGTGTTNMIGNSTAVTGTFPSAYTVTTTNANATRYIAINCAFTAGGANSLIQTNTIAGFALYTSSTAATTNGVWCAINVTAGNATIGGASAGLGNTIGATSGQGSVYTITSGSGGAAVGIFANSANTVTIQNNTIGAIDAVGTSASVSGGFNGIDVGSSAGNIIESNNTIGNTTADNIRVGYTLSGANLSNAGTLTSASGTSAMIGIRSTATGTTYAASSNTLRGWAVSGSATTVTGIISSGTMASGATTVTLNGNALGTSGLGWVRYAFANSGTLTGISCANTVATTHSVQNNDIRGIQYDAAGSGSNTYISFTGGTQAGNVSTVAGNTFTNLNVNTTGSATFISHGYSIAATGTQTINNNSIVTAFNKGGAGGTVTGMTSGTSSATGAIANHTNNNFSNITVTGATAITGITNTDGSSSGATRTVTGNTFNNWTGGSSAIIGMNYAYFGGSSSVSNNTITNITGQGNISAITIGSSGNLANPLLISGNTINTLTSNGTGGNVLGISCANTSPVVNITGHDIFGLSSTGASSSVTGITVTGGTLTGVFQNSVHGLSGSGATSPTIVGISATGGTAVNIHRNKVYDLSESAAIATTNGSVTGILLSGGTTVNTYNNLVGDLRAPAANLADAIRGIAVTSTSTSTTQNVINNTVRLSATSSGAVFGTTGVFHTASATATTATLNLRNNIIINLSTPNTTGVVTALRRSAVNLGNYGATSNKNLLYAGTPGANNAIMYDGTTVFSAFGPAATAGTYQNAVNTRDGLSFTGEAAYDYSAVTGPTQFFQSITGSDPTFLHILAGATTLVESGADPIASPAVTVDYDGDTRNATKPDVGADEFAGTTPAPAITFNSLTPGTTTQCDATARLVSVDATTPSGTITSVTLNYAYNGVAQSPVTMTNTTGNTWTGTIPAPTSPTNATVTWSVTATNSVPLSVVYTGASYSDVVLAAYNVVASANPTTACAGSNVVLTVAPIGGNSSSVGTATTKTTDTEELTVFCNRRVSFQVQTIYTASSLTSAGLAAGQITGLIYNIATIGDNASNGSFTVKIQNTASTTLSGFVTSGFTTVFTPQTYTHAVGLNTITFTTPYNWDGTSNLLIEITHTGTDQINNAQTFYTDMGTNVTAWGFNGTTTATLSTKRFNAIFMSPPLNVTNYSWSDANGVVGTGNPLTVQPTTTSSYTATITALGCTKASNAVAVTVNPLPAAPNGNNSVQCGTGVPTCFVTTGGGGGGFKWYSAQTGGTLLQNGGGTYTSSISATTHFWVSESNGTCESLRTEVIASVNLPDAVQASVDNNNPCANTQIQLTATTTGNTNGNVYTFVWTASPATGSGIPTSQAGGTGTFGTPASTNVTPTASGTYTYTVTATDGTLGCVTTSTVVVTVKALPQITSTTATPSTVCAGTNVTLNGTTGTQGPGSVAVGAGASTIPGFVASGNEGYGNPFNYWYGNQKTQYIYRASELTALTMSAGNITALSLEVPSVGGVYTMTGFTISIGNTAQTVATTTPITTGLTQVYTNASQPVSTGVNTYTFTTPFNWDGTSNIVVQICWGNSNSGVTASSATVKGDVASFVSTTVMYQDGSIGTGICTQASGGNQQAVSNRPKITFSAITGVNNTGSHNFVWQPGSLSGPTQIVTPSVTTTYTLTATNPTTTCSNTATVTVTVNPLPPAPAGSNGTDQCGTGLTDASVSSNNVTDPQAPPFFKWYFVPTGGTAQQSSTSTTFTTPITGTTDFYVSEVSANGCEGPRVHISTVVSTADPINVNATPTTVCIGGSTDISASYTPDFNNYATFTLSASPLSGSGLPGSVPLVANATGSDPYSVTPTATGTYTYTIVAFDPDKNCSATNTVVVSVKAYPVITSATATPSTICAGATVTLNGKSIAAGPPTATIGTATTLTSATTQPTAFCNRWPSYRMQTIYTAAEMQAQGMIAGNITSMAFNITTLGDGASNNNFVVKIANTALASFVGATDFTSTASGFTTVFPAQTYTHAVGVNTINFSTPFVWDGTSNIIIDVQHDGLDLTNNSITYYTATAVNMVAYTTTAASNTASFSTTRLNVTFGAQTGVNNTANYNWTWNPGNINAGTTGTTTVTPTTTTVYTVTATTPGSTCSVSATTTVTVNPVPAAPSTNTPVTRCGPGSVTLTASGGSGIFKWYTVSTGGSPVFTGPSYTVAVPVGTTTYYVDETSEAGCIGPRTAVVVTASTPPTLAITAGGPTTFCAGGSVTLNGATGSDPSYVNFSWAPATGLSATTGASVTASPATTTTYTLTATDNGTPGCANTATQLITVNPNPVITNPHATPATICVGGSSTLSALSVNAVAGTAPTSAATTTTQGGSPFRAGGGAATKTQLLYTAAELQAAGFAPGNFTSIGFNFTSASSGTLPNFSVKMGHTAATVLTGTFETAPSTIVYAPTTINPSTTGIFTLTFSTPFTWDGTSNLLIEFCHDLPVSGLGSGFVDATTTATNMTNQLLTTNACTVNTGGSVQTTRPVAILGGQVGTDISGTLNWLWNPGGLGGSSVSVNPTVTTSYTVTATNPVTNCSSTFGPVVVTVTTVGSTASATPSTPVCAGTAVTLNGTATGGGPFSYEWKDATTTLASGTTTGTVPALVVNPTVTTSYTLTVQDACGNPSVSTVTVTVNPLPTVGVTPTSATFCNPGTGVTLNGSGAVTYSWAPSTGLSATTGQTVVASPTTGTVYTVTGTGANGCTNTATTTITVAATPTSSASASPTTVCAGSPLSLTSSGSVPATGYTVGSIAVSAETPSGSPTVLASGGNTLVPFTAGNTATLDDVYWDGISLPFTFGFFGNNYTTVRISSNGNIQFGPVNGGTGTSANYSWVPQTIPTAGGNIDNFIAGPWNDQDLATTPFGTLRYFVNGVAPNRKFVVSYEAVHVFNSADNNTSQIILNENGTIDVLLLGGGFTSTGSKAIGIENADGSLGTAPPSRNLGTWTTAADEAWRFTPNAPNFTYAWTGPNSFTSAQQNPTIANPSPAASGTYSVIITNVTTGCSSLTATTPVVTVNPRPTAVMSGSGTYCQGTNTTTNLTVNFTGTAPWNYTYTVDGGSPVSGTTSSNPLTITVTPSNAAGHVFTYAISALSDANCASIAADLTGTGTVTVNPLAANPTATVVQPTCALGTGTINVTSPLGAGNTYSLDGINFQPSPSFPGQAPGTYTVYVNNSFGCFSPATVNVTVNPQPFVPGAPVITGTVNVCPFIGVAGAAGQLTYTATATGFGTQTFNWVVPTTNVTIVSGQGTGTLVLSFQNGFATQANKQLRLTVTNQCGTSTMTIYYLAAQIPNTPAPIVGPTDACPLLGGPAVAYTINKAPGAKEYLWSVPAGASFTRPNGVGVNDTTILVSFTAGYATGPITVQSSNDCGVSGIRSLTVTRIAPSQPNIISGPTNACPYITPNAAATYTVPAVPGVTYTWSGTNGAVMSSPQGSNTMSVSFPIGYTGGTISVTATTGCGTSAARNLAITTLNPATPSVPDIIQTHFCGEPGGRKFTYTLSSTPANATSVVWTVPAGATFINLTPISIEVTYPDAAVSGVVTVQAVNPCANSVIRSVNVKLPACPTSFAGTNNGTNGTAESKGGVAPVKASTPAPALAEALEVKIFPNPTVSDFKLEVLTAGTEEITVRVLDNMGRLYKNFKLMPNQIIALGAELKSGSYLVEVRQGKTVKTTKVIKF
ncbi:MAG: T9SS type A sorting domain-containing protein [Ferruginibacter sp.]